jgi:tetratricopeptide (TPR) repeat protein
MADLSQYVPQLPFDTLAQFEATSGMMILNVDLKTFLQSGSNYAKNTPTPDDIELYSTINHETYHYFQTLSSGYQYRYASEMWRLIVEEGNAEVLHERFKRWKEWIKIKGIQLYARVKSVKMSTMDVKRLIGFEALAEEHQKALEWEGAAHGDFSLLSANSPSLARGFDHLWTQMTAANAHGLATIDLIEGSAIIFQHLLTHGREGLEDRLAEAWEATGETYRRSFEAAQAICGPRALDIVLPAAAIALRYEKPTEAYSEFLTRLNATAPGTEISEARAIASNPPRIPPAGEYLGTALDVRRAQLKRKGRYAVYDEVLDKLEKRAWGFDEIDLLSDPGPAQKMDSFPFVTVVKEGPIRTNLDQYVLTQRLLCGNIVLRTAKVPRYRREAEKRIVDRAHAAISSIVDPLSAADEYNQLGLNYLDQEDPDQAEAMMQYALSIYVRYQHQKGIARELYNLGLVQAARNDREGAQKMYKDSLTISEEIKDQELIAEASANLGSEYMRVHRLEEAETLIRKALAIEETLDLKEGMAIEYFNLGRIYVARKDLDEARKLLTKSVELYRAASNNSMADTIEKGLAEMEPASQQQTPAS